MFTLLLIKEYQDYQWCYDVFEILFVWMPFPFSTCALNFAFIIYLNNLHIRGLVMVVLHLHKLSTSPLYIKVLIQFAPQSNHTILQCTIKTSPNQAYVSFPIHLTFWSSYVADLLPYNGQFFRPFAYIINSKGGHIWKISTPIYLS